MTNKSPQFRIGNGYDIHRLVADRDLIIGGFKLNHPDGLGLDGHSDADVLSHSIMDALLGALSLGDIGKYFPPSDEKWKNANSLFLLSKVIELIRKKGWEVNNIEKPFEEIKSIIENTPRTEIVEIDGDYLHAEATSKWMKYVDDLEVSFLPDSNILLIRSESRVGEGDLGVNQKRIDSLKSKMF